MTALPESKMKRMREALLSLPEETGWLLWLDADLVILRHDVRAFLPRERESSHKRKEKVILGDEQGDRDAGLLLNNWTLGLSPPARAHTQLWAPLGVGHGGEPD